LRPAIGVLRCKNPFQESGGGAPLFCRQAPFFYITANETETRFMNVIFTFCLVLALLPFTYAATPVAAFPAQGIHATADRPGINANQIFLPVGTSGKLISLVALSTISVKDFETVSGKKLTPFDKLSFKLGQYKLRNKIEDDGTIKNKALKYYAKTLTANNEAGSHLAGFVMGFFLSIIGVLIVYLIDDRKKKARVKWAWIGFAAGSVIALLFALFFLSYVF
jgi:hypothetical protein